MRWSRHWRGWLPLLLLIVLIAALTACTSPQTTFSPKSEAAGRIHTLYILITVMASLVGAAVLGALAYALIKFRARPGRTASQVHGNTKLEIAWTLAPVAVMLIIGAPTIVAIADAAKDPEPDALKVHVVAHQWWWEVEYRGPADAFPPGVELPVITANEIHVPVGRQVSVTLESADVVHSFWLPQLVGKVDAFPGLVRQVPVFTPQEVGVFSGLCAEFCGIAHANMRFRVIVESLGDFKRWAESLQTPPSPSTGLAAQGEQLFMEKGGCLACHTVAGTDAQGKIGPNLTRFGSRTTLGAGILENTDENLRLWISDLREEKPGALLMPTFQDTLTEGEIAALAAYLRGQRVE